MKPGWLVFILSLLMCGLCNAESSWARELSRLNNSIEKTYKKKYGVELIGTGGGGVQGFELYSPQFASYAPTTKEDGTILLLTLMEDLFEKINNNKILVDGMRSFPFRTENLGVVICFFKSDGNFVNKGQLESIGVSSNRIRYGYHVGETKQMDWKYEAISSVLCSVDPLKKRFPYLWECVEKSGKKQ